MNSNKKLLVAWGWTGGHVFPLLNLIQYINKHTHFNKESEPVKIHWVWEKNSIESRVTTENSIPFSPIICGKLRRYFSFKTFLAPFQILIGIVQSMIIIYREKPQSIFSKGGYVSLPVAIAGWVMNIPVYLHESDSIPGLANQIVARFSRGIFASFHEAKKYFPKGKMIAYGPLLPELLFTIRDESIEENEKTQLLINCGSQGSSVIFDTILLMLESKNLHQESFDIHLILGTLNGDYREKFSHFPHVHLYDFFYDQNSYFRLIHNSDIVITRSGSSIFEFDALGLHMIMIPHPHTGNNHQYYNAKIFEKKWHGCILQENLENELPEVLKKYISYKKPLTNKEYDMTIYQKITETVFH